MKTKIAKLLLIVSLFFTALCIPANAIVASEADVQQKINTVQALASYDPMSMINKSELIGYRMASYNMFSSQYKSSASLAIEQFRNLLTQIQLIKNSSELSDSEKNLHLTTLYQDADKILYDLDNKTVNYIYSCKTIMPTITFQKFVKSFSTFYNSLYITNNAINVR